MVRQCLIDADVLLYEIGFAAETAWRHSNFPNGPPSLEHKQWLLENPPPFEKVRELFTERVAHIEHECESNVPSIFFFTGNTNFRNEIAKRTPYKDRPGIKPYHYYNLKAFIKGTLEFREQDGLEADDLMSIEQTLRGDETIICTRDKDLRSVGGWHFGWELGNQPAFGPLRVSGYGVIELSDDRKKVSGYGLKFFLAQCLMGDRVDSIPGLPNCGPVAAFDILANTSTYDDGVKAVYESYAQVYGEAAPQELLEQGRLLWMTRRLNEDGSPVLWNLWEEYGEK